MNANGAERAPVGVTISDAVRRALEGETLVDCFARPVRGGASIAFRIEGLDGTSTAVTWDRLHARARSAAARLRALGVGQGERVFLVLPTGEDFVFLFWATLLAGATPVPAYPPAGIRQLPTFSASLGRMVAATDATLVIVPEPLRDLLSTAGEPALRTVRILTPEDIWSAAAAEGGFPQPGPEDLALVQFSSGSTREPQGICLTHANVLSNVRVFTQRMALQPDDVVVSWLPLYHDMGLIGTMIGALAARVPLVLLSPLDFLRRPAFWIEVMSRHGATISVAPQFAYTLCVRKVRPQDLHGMDLSRLRILLNGSEPIGAEAVAKFEERFRPLGLRRGVVTPCYGLGEATLAVAMGHPGRGLRVERMEEEGRLLEVVSAGPPMDGTEVAILAPDEGWQPDGAVGEILVRGPGVCRGYLGRDGVAEAVDGSGWLRSGDLGFLRGGELFVTGRKKDLVILGGRNFYPQEIEEEVACVGELRPGRIAAFGVAEPERGTEVLVLVAEANGAGVADPARAVAALRQRLLGRFGVAPHDVVLVERERIPITTSGKLRRSAARAIYERDGFEGVLFRLRPSSRNAPLR